jgi:hypothetical protein
VKRWEFIPFMLITVEDFNAVDQSTLSQHKSTAPPSPSGSEDHIKQNLNNPLKVCRCASVVIQITLTYKIHRTLTVFLTDTCIPSIANVSALKWPQYICIIQGASVNRAIWQQCFFVDWLESGGCHCCHPAAYFKAF